MCHDYIDCTPLLTPTGLTCIPSCLSNHFASIQTSSSRLDRLIHRIITRSTPIHHSSISILVSVVASVLPWLILDNWPSLRLRLFASPSHDHPSARASPGCRYSNAGQGNTEGAATVKTAPKKVRRKRDDVNRYRCAAFNGRITTDVEWWW